MNALLVDDEKIMINDLESSVDWAQFGIIRVFTSLNIRQAKEVILENNIDLILCDIEMPQGSGLDLLAWINENKPGIESIILTYHPDFGYTKVAISLGSTAYLLKPVDYTELETTIRKTVKKINEVRKHQSMARKQFWLDIVDRKIPFNIAPNNLNASQLRITCHDEMEFYPVLFSIKQYNDEIQERQLKDFAFNNIVEEIMNDDNINGEVIRIGGGLFAVIISQSKNPDIDLSIIKRICQSCIEPSARYLKCNITCYIDDKVSLCNIPNVFDTFFDLDNRNVTKFNTVLFANRIKQINSMVSPDINRWQSLLDAGLYEKFLNEVNDHLTRCSLAFGFGVNELKQFYHDFLQMLYFCMKQKNLYSHELFKDSVSLKLCDNAIKSIEDMLLWVRHVLNKMYELFTTKTNNQSIVEDIINYIKLNLKNDISREDIAVNFHFSSDYIDRLFNKKLGCSVSKFILNERISLSVELLTETDMPVSLIATTLGFNKISHFSSLFRKYQNVSPVEYRRLRRKQNKNTDAIHRI